jgi:hypothetical protein
LPIAWNLTTAWGRRDWERRGGTEVLCRAERPDTGICHQHVVQITAGRHANVWTWRGELAHSATGSPVAGDPAGGLTPTTTRTYHLLRPTSSSPPQATLGRSGGRSGPSLSGSIATRRFRGLRFEGIGWENYSSAGVGRPQELITQQTLKRFRPSLASRRSLGPACPAPRRRVRGANADGRERERGTGDGALCPPGLRARTTAGRSWERGEPARTRESVFVGLPMPDRRPALPGAAGLSSYRRRPHHQQTTLGC